MALVKQLHVLKDAWNNNSDAGCCPHSAADTKVSEFPRKTFFKAPLRCKPYCFHSWMILPKIENNTKHTHTLWLHNLVAKHRSLWRRATQHRSGTFGHEAAG